MISNSVNFDEQYSCGSLFYYTTGTIKKHVQLHMDCSHMLNCIQNKIF